VVLIFYRSVLRARSDDGFVADTGESGGETASGGAAAPDDSDTHDVSLAHGPPNSPKDDDRGGRSRSKRVRPIDLVYGRGMGILEGKKIVITGVLTDASLAFGVARIARQEGAEVVLTGAGRALSLTKRTARKLATDDQPAPAVFEF